MDSSIYKNLMQHAPFGFAYQRMVLNSHGEGVDYVFLDVNLHFEMITGLLAKDIIGKNARSVVIDFEQSGLNRIAQYSRVCKTGQDEIFEQFSRTMRKWIKVYAHPVSQDTFTTIFFGHHYDQGYAG